VVVPFGRGSVREKIYSYLADRPAGVSAEELVSTLVRGGPSMELGPRLIHQLLGDDPNFVFEPATGAWTLARNRSLKVPLDEASFVVVDLETTGGRLGPGMITEIGACRMRGGLVVESFQTLVRPLGPIASFVSRLTSITDEMVRDAPPIEQVIPAFRAFLGDAVMVAHNAAFDYGFLDFEFRRIFGIGLPNPVLCTLSLSRRFLPSLRRRRLDAIAEHFGLSTENRHRAFGDARITAEIFAVFLDMARARGISRLDRLLDMQTRSLTGRRIERHVKPEVIAAIPDQPGVYLMRDERGQLLYIGKAGRLRKRVASYFNAGLGIKAKVADLICHIHQIETRTTSSTLEAALLEARLIREHKPPYNRMLKGAPRTRFIKLDLSDDFPRLSVTTTMSARRGILYAGPFIGVAGVETAIDALSRHLGLRTCTGRLTPAEDFSPCIRGQIGRCSMPCNMTIDEDEYAVRVRRAVEFIRGRGGALTAELASARDRAAAAMRFEEANRFHRDLQSLVVLSHRVNRLAQIVTENNLLILLGPPQARTAYVVLSGRLAMKMAIDTADAIDRIANFVCNNFEVYRARPVHPAELEEMTIVARWLRERTPEDGKIVFISETFARSSARLAQMLESV
jgi:DNA polymerase-3 subunit epsilon